MALVTPTHSKGECSFAITGQTGHGATAAGSVGCIENPEDCTIIVIRCVAYISANSTGACNLTVGHAATAIAAHDGHDIFDAAAMAAAAGTATIGHACGTAADPCAVVAADEVIAAFCSADSSGLAGIIYLEYVRVDD